MPDGHTVEHRAAMLAYIEQMRALKSGDPEANHGEADDILRRAIETLGGDLGAELVAAFEDVEKWYA